MILSNLKNPRIWPEASFGPGSGFESRIWIQIRNLDRIYRSENGHNFFLYTNFYAASSSNIKRLPSLSTVTWLQIKCEINLRSTRISHIYAFCLCLVSLPHACESLAALSTLGCALTFTWEAKLEIEAKILFRLETKILFRLEAKKSLISHNSLRCETPKIWSENKGKIS